MPKKIFYTIFSVIFISVLAVSLGFSTQSTVKSQPLAEFDRLDGLEERGLPIGGGYSIFDKVQLGNARFEMPFGLADDAQTLHTIFQSQSKSYFYEIDYQTGISKTVELEGIDEYVADYSMSANDNFIYALSENRIMKFSRENYAVVDEWQTEFEIRAISGEEDERLFISGGESGDYFTKMVDFKNRQVIDTFNHPRNRSPIQTFDPNNQRLFVIYDNHYLGGQLYSFDVSQGSLSLIDSTEIGGQIHRFKHSEDGSKLMTLHFDNAINQNYIVIYDSVTLNQIARFDNDMLQLIDTHQVSGGDFSSDGASFHLIFTSYSDLYPDHLVGEVVIETNQIQRWTAINQSFIDRIDDFVRLSNGRLGLMESGDLHILIPTDYGIALPLIGREYCPHPYQDDFSTFQSGWPVVTTGERQFQYIEGEYEIYLAQRNNWTAVTQNHAISGEALGAVSITGRINVFQDGLYGLVFGINDDWSEFYTFEILPRHKQFVILKFTAEEGWQLMQEQYSDWIRADEADNRLTMQRIKVGFSSYRTYFYINDHQVTQWAADGRLGFSAGSFGSHVRFRFDDYFYTGPTCPQPALPDAAVETVPFSVDDHPTVDEILSGAVPRYEPNGEK